MEDANEAEEMGVAVALEKLCTLESRLRQAIQGTHSLHRSFGRDMGAVDREREALLLIREHLELLEDKLREYRTMAMDPKGYDDKAIALSQLDGLRKDLLRTAKDRIDYVLYNKGVVKEIVAFADTGSGDEPALEKTADDGDAHGAGYSTPLSPSQSSEENDFYSAKARDSSTCFGPSSNGTSPFAAKRDLRVAVEDFQGNHFSYPAPVSTPSVRASLARESTGGTSDFDIGTSAQELNRCGGSAALSNASRNHGTYVPRKPSRTAVTHDPHGTSYGDHDLPPRPPLSAVASCKTPVRDTYELSGKSGAHHQDPSYGGKVNLLSFKGRENGQAAAAAHVVDHPKIVHDSSYADEQMRLMVSGKLEGEIRSADTASPIRKALQKRMAANAPPQHKTQRDRSRRFLGFLGSCLRLAVAGAVSAVAAVTLSAALRKNSPALLVLPSLPVRKRAGPQKKLVQEQLKPVERSQPVERPKPQASAKQKPSPSTPGRPRADGGLVPDFMHKSHFKSTDIPPTGVLTSTTQPPGGEMFPVVPPPTSKHVRG